MHVISNILQCSIIVQDRIENLTVETQAVATVFGEESTFTISIFRGMNALS